MKSKDIRTMNPDEMERKLVELKETMFNLRFQHGTGQLENTQKLKQTRRDIARLNTIITETKKAE